MRFAAAAFHTQLVASVVALCCCCCCCCGARDDGALYLTPLIRAGKIDVARAACKVKPLTAAVVSYSGYLTVDDERESNMFFWFFPAASGAADAPVLLWLQGGPGTSSLYAVFNEHGPFSVAKGRDALELRNHTWTATHSVLYVDNPVGTGYSFTADDAGYSTDQTAVGINLYEALVQFFTLFPEYRKNDFYVTGESYAGKYVPAVSHAIHVNNPNASVNINLKGLAIGNGMVDPINQLVYAEYLFQHGLVDESGKCKFEEMQNLIRRQIVAGQYKDAARTFDQMLLKGNQYPYPTLFQNLTGMQYFYNELWSQDPARYGDWEKYVQLPDVRAALHVGRRPLNDGAAVEQHLMDDLMRSVSPWLAALLDAGRYRVLLYSGQLDIVVPHPGTSSMALSLKWSGAERFKNATRTPWLVNGQNENEIDVAGYSTTAGPLTVLLVRDSGHMVPGDTPKWGLDLINRFTAGKPF